MEKADQITETRRRRDDSSDLPPTDAIPTAHNDPVMDLPQLETEPKKTFWQRVKEPGSVWQIIFAALLAIAIGLIVTTQVDEVPDAAVAITSIIGTLWLRALRAVGTLDPHTAVFAETNMAQCFP